LLYKNYMSFSLKVFMEVERTFEGKLCF